MFDGLEVDTVIDEWDEIPALRHEAAADESGPEWGDLPTTMLPRRARTVMLPMQLPLPAATDDLDEPEGLLAEGSCRFERPAPGSLGIASSPVIDATAVSVDIDSMTFWDSDYDELVLEERPLVHAEEAVPRLTTSRLYPLAFVMATTAVIAALLALS